MTGNLTNAVLSLIEMLLARGSFEAADFGTEKLVISRLSGRLSGGCRRLLCARLNWLLPTDLAALALAVR